MSGYQRINFKDQNVERPKTYDVTNNPDGSITLIESFGNVEELGTPINQENMNHIEDGIDAVSFSKFNIDSVYKKDDLITEIQDGELKIFKSLNDNNFGRLLSENEYWEEVEIAGGKGSGFNLFDTKISDHILQGEEAKGWALQGTYVSGALYPDFYNKCLEQKTSATETSATLGSSTLTMFVNDNGHQFFNIADKSIVDTFYNTYGIADFYGIDEENERIFLPRNKYFQQLTDDISKVNEMVEAGLPNITGSARSENGAGAYTSLNVVGSGAFVSTNGASKRIVSNSTENRTVYDLSLDASKSNSIYGKSDTVQPPSSLKLLYYCVGNTVVNDAEIDAGGLVAQIELKANTSLNNVFPSQEFINETVSWGMPDYNSGIAITNQSFTAPADGFMTVHPAGGISGKIYVNGEYVGIGSNKSADASVSFCVSKNDIVTLTSGYTFGTQSVFYPLKGVK